MTAHDDQTPLTAAEAAVRARLAEARHTDPVPDDVVGRLDAVLADLTADRREQTATPLAPVVPLSASGRRRRALATGLVAAAAVVALGVALPQVLEGTSGGSDEATSASTADRGASSLEPGPAEDRDSGSGAGGGAAESGPPSEGPGAESERSGSAYAAAVELRSDEPLRPAVRLLARRGPVTAYDAGTACAADVGAGDRVAATWDGRPAVVVLRPAEADRRVVEVFECDAARAVARTTVPAR